MTKPCITIIIIISLGYALPAFSQDTSCGIAWGPIQVLSGPNSGAIAPFIASQGETLHATWDFGGEYRMPYARSTDAGLTWEPTRDLITDTVSFPYPVHDPWILANKSKVFIFFIRVNGITIESPVFMINSSDAGVTWSSPVPVTPDSGGRLPNAAILGDTLIVNGGPWIWQLSRSTDGGDTWERSQTRSPFVPIAVSKGMLHCAYPLFDTTLGAIEIAYSQSRDLGDTWNAPTFLSELDGWFSNIPAIGVTFPETDSAGILTTWRDTKYGCQTLVGCSIILRRSTDAGLSWQPETLMTELPNGYNHDRNGGQISSLGNRVGVTWTNDELGHINFRYSVDAGSHWSELCDITPGRSAGLQSSTVTPLGFHVIWAETNSGCQACYGIYYRRGVLLPTSVPGEIEEPKEFTLSQNYPNPFNPSTKISFELHTAGFVSLKIYDLFGREVATLMHEKKNRGTYDVEWNSNGVASGVYYYRLVTSAANEAMKTETRRMILLQ